MALATPFRFRRRQSGGETIVVIRTVPSQMYYTPFKRMERWLGRAALQPLVNPRSIMKRPTARSNNLLKSRRVAAIIEIYPRRNRCTAWRWAAVSRRCVRITKPGNYAGVISRHRWCKLSPQRCLRAIRRGLPCRKRWSCLRRRWPMIRMWRCH